MAKRVKPMPEAVFGKGPFAVNAVNPAMLGAAGLSSTDKTLLYSAPTDPSLVSKAIRLHEYGHLAVDRVKDCTPALHRKMAKRGIGEDWIQALFDMRVNNAMCRTLLGADTIQYLPLDYPAKVAPEEFTRAQLAQTFLRLMRLSGATQRQWTDVMNARLTATERELLNTFSQTVRHTRAKRCASLIEQLWQLQRLFASDSDEEKQPEPLDSLDRIPSDVQGGMFGKGCYRHTGEPPIPPGDMELISLACTIPAKDPRGRKRKPAFLGPFRYPHRALLPATVGDAFAMPRRGKGAIGSCLLDASGSMGITYERIKDIVVRMPYATIAVYAGKKTISDSGYLLICGKQGRIASPEEFRQGFGQLGGGNVVDAPALEWLCQQKGPRIWVSDGSVTGKDDRLSSLVSALCEQSMIQGRIRRVPSYKQLGELLHYLETGRTDSED